MARPHRTKSVTGSAAAHFGVIGLSDPGYGPRLGDGGMRAFAHTFCRRFDEIAETRRPEWRRVVHSELELRRHQHAAPASP